MRGTAERPRLSVYRSNRHINAQLIDDVTGSTLVSVSDRHVQDTSDTPNVKGAMVESAFAVGKLLAAKAKGAGIVIAVFDRGHYRYHGQVKAVAEGAREGGLRF